jgi:Mg-chelatase subunit ChlD
LRAICKFIVFIFISGAIIFTPEFVRSQDARNMDVVLVIDSSGSMQKTDPLSLRVPAAKLFLSLLDESDRAGIVSFSDKGYVLSDLEYVNSQENKEKLFSAADRISADGLYTNLFEAFNSGYAALSLHKESGREKIIILLSDGIMDVGNLDQDKRLTDTLENTLTETLRKEHIRVYTIAFTEHSDRKLLEMISKRTKGFYNTALTAKDLHGVFTSIFESLKSPEMVPMSENSFIIDSTIEELTIVATKGDPDTEIQIISPDGDTYSSNHKYSGVGWFMSENFDMVTVQKPLEGKWEILFSTGENNKAYIITDLKLQTDFDQMYAIFGEQMDVRIWLEKDGSRITEDHVLDKISVYIELTGPDGNTSKLQAFYKGDGLFQRAIVPFTSGNHKMKLVAEGMTFKRAKSFAFNVANLEESKKDLKEQREEKKRQLEAGNRHEGEKDEGDVSFIKLFAQFIVMNIILGIMVLAFVKKEKVRDFIKSRDVKGLTQFIRRNQKEKEGVEAGEVTSDAEEGAESAQSAEGAAATDNGDPGEEQASREATEIGKQPDADVVEEEPAEKDLPEPETEEIKTIESQPDTERPENETGEDSQKKMVDLEEIEMEEKGKQEKALQNDTELGMKSFPDTEGDTPLNADQQEAEEPGEDAETSVETVSDESDDIEIVPKGGPEHPDDPPREAMHEEAPEQTAGPAVEELPDIQPAPDDSGAQRDETHQESVPEESRKQTAEPFAEADAFDSVIAEMEEAIHQKQGSEEIADDVAPDRTLSEESGSDTQEDINGA